MRFGTFADIIKREKCGIIAVPRIIAALK